MSKVWSSDGPELRKNARCCESSGQYISLSICARTARNRRLPCAGRTNSWWALCASLTAKLPSSRILVLSPERELRSSSYCYRSLRFSDLQPRALSWKPRAAVEPPSQ